MAALSSNAVLAQTDSAADSDVRGVIKAQHEAVLRAELAARVATTPVRTGESFKKDDVLISFDCRRQNAEAAAANASFSAAKSRYNSSVEMKEYDAAGDFDVELAKAEMHEARARAQAIRVQTQHCEIKAPYDGKVAELNVNAHETPGPDQALLKIVGSEHLELRLIVPSKWLVWLTPGSEFSFTVDETGSEHAASVASIGAEVDAVSRTVPIMGRFKGTPANVLPGMSGSARFRDLGRE